MKRIIIACLLILASFSYAFISSYLISDISNDIIEKLDYMTCVAESASEDELLIMSENLIAEWEKKDWIFHASVNAESAFEAEKNILNLKKLAESGDTEEFRAQCVDAYTLVYSIKESESINLQNIF